MLQAFMLLLFCQLLGTAIRVLGHIPMPGPVIGMAVLAVVMVFRGRVPEQLDELTRRALPHLSLLFVPPAVGVIRFFPLLQREWLAITAALAVSTLVSAWAAALAMSLLLRERGFQPRGGMAAEIEGEPE